MKIAGWQKLSLIDFPGKVACTVFLSGCNWRCPFCYNPELVLPEEIRKHYPIPEKHFFEFLKGRKAWLEAVTIGGGEPTLNQGLPEFCRKIKAFGFELKLDTNGSNPEMLQELIEKKLVDYVAMDIKAPKDKYPKVIGFGDCSGVYLLERIEKSTQLLKEKGDKIAYEFRTTIVPKLHRKNDVLKIAHWLAPAKKYVLQNFQAQKNIEPGWQEIKPYPRNFLFSLKELISPFFDVVEVR